MSKDTAHLLRFFYVYKIILFSSLCCFSLCLDWSQDIDGALGRRAAVRAAIKRRTVLYREEKQMAETEAIIQDVATFGPPCRCRMLIPARPLAFHGSCGMWVIEWKNSCTRSVPGSEQGAKRSTNPATEDVESSEASNADRTRSSGPRGSSTSATPLSESSIARNSACIGGDVDSSRSTS